MSVEMLRDLDPPYGWLLLVEGSEQSYVTEADPTHLEFEYVQHMAIVIDTWRPDARALRALHLGGGLCTLPRWLAARRPGSRQWVVEAVPEVARLCRSLPLPDGVTLRRADAAGWLAAPGGPPGERTPAGVDLVVVDLYSGPDTVLAGFGLDGLRALAGRLSPDGLVVANLSDAAPFDLARAVAAGAAAVWETVAVVAEPPVLRGRRSGNLVVAATDGPLDRDALRRRLAGGAVRGRLLVDDDLHDWLGTALPAATAGQLPESGEVAGRSLDGRASAAGTPTGRSSAEPHSTGAR